MEEPKRKLAIKLKVIYRRVECPYGFNDSLGGHNLHDCYLDSLATEHRCHDPLKTGASRCPQIPVWHATHGWRTYAVVPEVTTVNTLGHAHQEPQLQILYQPLREDGTAWYAVNGFTGQRFQVVIAADGHRTTPEGESITNDFRIVDPDELDKRRLAGGVIHMPYVLPIWEGVRPRQDWTCRCTTCTGAEYNHHRGEGIMDDDEKPPSAGGWNEPRKTISHSNIKSAGTNRYFPDSTATAAKRQTRGPEFSPPRKPVKLVQAPKKERVIKTSDVLSQAFQPTSKKR